MVTPKSPFCAKSIKNSQKQVKNGSFSAVFWSKCGDSELGVARKSLMCRALSLRNAQRRTAPSRSPKSSYNKKGNNPPQGQIVSLWSKCGDSNSRPPVPETGALPTALHLEVLNFMPGATRIYASCALFDTQIA